MTLEIGSGNRRVTFRIESEGDRDPPWAVDFGGRTFTAATGRPTLAVQQLIWALEILERIKIGDQP